ncbi:hypothetical protein GCM10010971_09000 [Silvimonas amylolytica]|uniref:Transmembrane protein n=1 Tax=Silvimonas amylolytica TaxID=449663 RepID=A0ABQ2PIB9_9NEIS|nr:hypothetical protein GCM10010971_09000 [Silvimonas amylolytica]
MRASQRAVLLTSVMVLVNVCGGIFITLTDVPPGILCMVIVLGAFSTVLCGTPLIMFLSQGWFTRYSEFLNSLKGGALAAYLQRFWSPRLIHALEDAEILKPGAPRDDWRRLSESTPELCDRLFARIYHEQYGLLPFMVPFVILLIVAWASSAVVATNYLLAQCPEPRTMQVVCVYQLPQALLVASLSGAFMFVVSDSVLSIRRRCLNISDVYWYSLRLFLAVPIALVIENIKVDNGMHVLTAFALGTFPVDVLLKQFRRFGFPQLGDQERRENAPDKLLVLEGVTLPVVATLEAEGINSIEQVATADPVLLSIRTGFPFRFTLRLGSQAIVRRHFGENATTLLPIGLGDVVPVYLLVQAMDQRPDMVTDSQLPRVEQPELVVHNAATRLFAQDDNEERIAIVKTQFRQIAAEEYTIMLARISPPDTGL